MSTKFYTYDNNTPPLPSIHNAYSEEFDFFDKKTRYADFIPSWCKVASFAWCTILAGVALWASWIVIEKELENAGITQLIKASHHLEY